MTKLAGDPRLPEDTATMIRQLGRIFTSFAQQVNGVTEGRIESYHAAVTAAPTTGQWKQGDFLLNAEPTELGSSPNKYTVFGYRCIVSGEPGTWVEMRCPTGN